MIAYFDTSALIPLLVLEPTSVRCREAWNAASRVACSRVGEVEAAAALAQALRNGRLDTGTYDLAVTRLDDLWSQVTAIPVDDVVVANARTYAADYALRGYDAVHCASAHLLARDSVVVVAGDRALLGAALSLRLAVWDVHVP